MSSVAILESLVQRALAAYPESASRIHRAKAIVEAGLVTTDEHGRTRVGEKRYIVGRGMCNCHDFQEMHAPGGRCKHRLAACLLQKMQFEECNREAALPTESREGFYRGVLGLVGLCADGSLKFQAAGSEGWAVIEDAYFETVQLCALVVAR